MAAPLEYTENDLEAHPRNRRLIPWMMREGFLWDGFLCRRCNIPMRLERSKNYLFDGYCWRCPESECKARRSIRDGSFFAFSNFSLRKQMHLLINFAAQSSARSAGLRYAIRRGSVGKFNEKVMRAYRRALARRPIEFSHGFEYELDELLIKRVSQPNGGIRNQWVAGILERQTGKCVYYRVDARSIAELIPPAVLAIPDGSFTYTDELAAYHTLETLHYQHYSVNHSAGEYERWDDWEGIPIHVHINTLEGYNNLIRQKLKSHTQRTTRKIDLVLDEVMYRKSGGSLFDPVKVREF